MNCWGPNLDSLGGEKFLKTAVLGVPKLLWFDLKEPHQNLSLKSQEKIF